MSESILLLGMAWTDGSDRTNNDGLHDTVYYLSHLVTRFVLFGRYDSPPLSDGKSHSYGIISISSREDLHKTSIRCSRVEMMIVFISSDSSFARRRDLCDVIRSVVR